MNRDLTHLLAVAAKTPMTQEQKDTQRRNYLIGEARIGLDRDEQRRLYAQSRGDEHEMRKLDDEAEIRVSAVIRYLVN